jgi:hypothetical protein
MDLEYEVIEHTLDTELGLYRIVIGAFETHQLEVGVTEAVENGNGGGEPIYEAVRVQVAEQDYLFAADDERWADRSDEEIAAEQRQIVVDAIASRAAAEEAERERRAAAIHRMPGGPL